MTTRDRDLPRSDAFTTELEAILAERDLPAPMPSGVEHTTELEAILAELGTDEHRVLLVLARRLLAGQRAYGRLDVATDERDWRRERADELADALVYSAIAEVAANADGR